MSEHADRPVHFAVRNGDAVVVKRYFAADGAAVHRAMCDLWASPFGARRRPVAMPEPLALEGADSVVMRALPGRAVGARGSLGDAVDLGPACAQVLAGLHTSGVVVPRRRHPAAVLRSLHRKAGHVAGSGWAFGPAWCETLHSLDGVGARVLADDELVVCHGDFSPRNVLVDAHGEVALIDFDRLQMAAPARDVEYWRAWCWATQAMCGDTPDWSLTEPFVVAYQEAAAEAGRIEAVGGGGGVSSAFHRGAALLRIAEGWSALRSSPEAVARILDEARATIAGVNAP